MPIQNLLLDLGGVLYEIDMPGTASRFQSLMSTSLAELGYDSVFDLPWFGRLDRGEIEVEAFVAGLKQDLQLGAHEAEIRQIWLDLLVGVFPGRLEAISQLSQRYHLALLSNTSRVHYAHYEPICRPMFEKMDYLFFSFEMGVTKPDPAIYEQALHQSGWRAEETLFWDDSRRNVEAAASLGIQTEWIDLPEKFDQGVAGLLR